MLDGAILATMAPVWMAVKSTMIVTLEIIAIRSQRPVMTHHALTHTSIVISKNTAAAQEIVSKRLGIFAGIVSWTPTVVATAMCA